MLVPVTGPDDRVGLVVVRRDIEPFRGEIALPGGFIETGESWQEAAVRELSEETGLRAEPDEVRLFDVHSSFNGYTLLVFGTVPSRAAEELPESRPTEEATEWFVLTEPTPLAFPTHTQAMADFLAAPDARTGQAARSGQAASA